jgi:hypothetical protein
VRLIAGLTPEVSGATARPYRTNDVGKPPVISLQPCLSLPAFLGSVARGSPGRSGRVSELLCSADGSCASKQVRSALSKHRSQNGPPTTSVPYRIVVIGTKVAARSRGYCGLPQRCAKRPSDQRHTRTSPTRGTPYGTRATRITSR